MMTVFFWTKYLPSGIKRLTPQEDIRMTKSNPKTIWSLLPDMQWRFVAKVRIFPLHDLGHGEIASADEDHVAKTGIVDGRTVGMTHGFVSHAAQAHVECFFS